MDLTLLGVRLKASVVGVKAGGKAGRAGPVCRLKASTMDATRLPKTIAIVKRSLIPQWPLRNMNVCFTDSSVKGSPHTSGEGRPPPVHAPAGTSRVLLRSVQKGKLKLKDLLKVQF